jgi:hypothetical protein
MKAILKLTLVASVLFTGIGNAQESGHLNVRTVVQKEEVIVNDAGETERRLVAADAVVRLRLPISAARTRKTL